MSTMKNRIAGFFLFICAFSFAYGNLYIPSTQLRKTEARLLEFVNKERTSKGLIPLRFSPELYRIAMDHNRRMSREKVLSHNFPGYSVLAERMVEAGLFFSDAGENIAFSNVYPADFIHKGFVESPEHYENIMDPEFREAGIAILETRRGFYITQEFATIITDISSKNMKIKVLEIIKESGLFPDTGISEKVQTVYGEKLKKLSESFLNDPLVIRKTGGIEGFDMNVVVFNKIEQIQNFIQNSNKEGKYGSIGFGVTSGRTAKYRGGAFSIVFLMKDILALDSRSQEQIEQDIVATLNHRFENNPGGRFAYSKKLSKKAEAAVGRYFRGDRLLLSESKYNILAYQADEPGTIPEEYESFFLSNRKKKYIGIKILRPEENGIPVNYFLLAFVFEK